METWEWLWKIFLILSIPRYFCVYFCLTLRENKLKISFGTLEVHKSGLIVINFMRFTIPSRHVMQNRLKFQVLLITIRHRKTEVKGISAIHYKMFQRRLYIHACYFCNQEVPTFSLKSVKHSLIVFLGVECDCFDEESK